MTTPELKPLKDCPFCGSEAKIVSRCEDGSYRRFLVLCSNEDCTSGLVIEDNVNAWNTRAPITVTDEMVENLAIYLYNQTSSAYAYGFGEIGKKSQDEFRKQAKAALEAAINGGE